MSGRGPRQDTGLSRNGPGQAARRATEPRAAAVTVLALADGLAAHVLAGYLDPEQALELLDAHLAHLFNEEAHDLS